MTRISFREAEVAGSTPVTPTNFPMTYVITGTVCLGSKDPGPLSLPLPLPRRS